VQQVAIDALHATGLLADDAFEKTPCDPAHQALSMAIDKRLSNLAEEPMQIELQEELGISERTLRRLTAEMFKRYGFVDTNWGEARVRRRLSAAVAFMSNPGATTSLVAQAVGYHSTQAMSRAFLRAGFPSPSMIRDALDELAER
jgi:AraC-like DNA-binding protein